MQHARRIYIPQHQASDKILWHYTKNGKYTVKSGYWLAMHYPDLSAPVLKPPPGDPILKTRIWKMKTSPKIKHFLWRILSLALGTGVELTRRGIPIDATCKCCLLHAETTNHLFFQCQYATATWRASNLPLINFSSSNTLAQNIDSLIQVYEQCNSPEIKHSPLWILWQLWKSRNDLIFYKINRDSSAVLAISMDNVLEWLGATKQVDPPISATTQPVTLNRWKPPPARILKCNYDASYRHNANIIGVGWILRDEFGTHIASASSQLTQGNNPLIAEEISLLHAIQSLWCRGYCNVIMENDCKELQDLLHHRSENATMSPLFTDIHSWTVTSPIYRTSWSLVLVTK